ncbi:hypothetical protein RHMOL_Rhmol01G0035100 [Rhododendron molle]|uniref:Uncharacterized protein n=1 Tax=Rhododendron molle TaxID=49168 RepID=A0ACC0PXG8_RHOML|nr:hypothetical protein RHMOL_Rhmol01G0035100 [Rhododendron molle]
MVSDTQITQQIVDMESTTMGEVNLINIWLPIPSSVSKVQTFIWKVDSDGCLICFHICDPIALSLGSTSVHAYPWYANPKTIFLAAKKRHVKWFQIR